MQKSSSFWWLAISPVVILVVSLVTPFTFWPEMFNWPFFLHNGWLPYRDFAMIHPPILPILLWFTYAIFGFSPETMQFFGALLLVLSDLAIVAVLAAQLKSRFLALFGGCLFAFLSIAFSGNHVWFESLLAPLIIICFWCHLRFLETRNSHYLIWSGILMGLMILTKQTAAYLLPVYYLVIGFNSFETKNFWKDIARHLFLLTAPMAILVAVYLGVLLSLGILPDFWRWGVEFVFLKSTAAHASQNSYVLLPTKLQALSLTPFFLVPFLISWQLRSRKFLLLSLWILFCGLFAFPRFEFWHLVPSLALFCLVLPLSFKGVGKKWLTLYLFLAVACGSLIWQKNWLHFHSFLDDTVVDESTVIANDYPNASLFILNGQDQLYYLTGKMPAVRPWIPQLPWYLEYYGVSFLLDIKKVNPEVIVYSPYLDKPDHGLGAYQPVGVIDFLKSNYKAQMTFPDGTSIWLRN